MAWAFVQAGSAFARAAPVAAPGPTGTGFAPFTVDAEGFDVTNEEDTS
jgi:hypothetical protein